MGIIALTSTDVRSRMVKNLGLNPSKFNLVSVEALAAALRRAAGFHCPCSPATPCVQYWRPWKVLSTTSHQ